MPNDQPFTERNVEVLVLEDLQFDFISVLLQVVLIGVQDVEVIVLWPGSKDSTANCTALREIYIREPDSSVLRRT